MCVASESICSFVSLQLHSARVSVNVKNPLAACIIGVLQSLAIFLLWPLFSTDQLKEDVDMVMCQLLLSI